MQLVADFFQQPHPSTYNFKGERGPRQQSRITRSWKLQVSFSSAIATAHSTLDIESAADWNFRICIITAFRLQYSTVQYVYLNRKSLD